MPSEIDELHQYGITRIYSPDDGRRMGLEGMIEDVLTECSKVEIPKTNGSAHSNGSGQYALGEYKDIIRISREISLAENGNGATKPVAGGKLKTKSTNAPVLGITGTGGAGKSSVTDEIVRRFLSAYQEKNNCCDFCGSFQKENRWRITRRSHQDEFDF